MSSAEHGLVFKEGQAQLSLLGDTVTSTAVFSEDGTYRYRLTRTWDPGLPVTVFCMLNPSTADHEELDPTVRRCVGFAKKWDTGGLVVVNAYAFRSTDPAGLWAVDDPAGPANDEHIVAAAAEAHDKGGVFVAAWGVHADPARVEAMMNLPGVDRAVCLGVTKNGSPRHPLYVRADTIPDQWPTTGSPEQHPTNMELLTDVGPHLRARTGANRQPATPVPHRTDAGRFEPSSGVTHSGAG